MQPASSTNPTRPKRRPAAPVAAPPAEPPAVRRRSPRSDRDLPAGTAAAGGAVQGIGSVSLSEDPGEPAATPDATAALWDEYIATRAVELRNQLTVHYSPLAKFVAFRVLSGTPSHVEAADLVSSGLLGLMDAIERYDPARGVRFSAYAVQRIRGAIVDELRRSDWAPRSVRKKARAIAEATADLEASLARTPYDHEIAERVDMSVAEYHAALRDITMTGVGTLDEVVRSDGAGSTVERKDLVAGPGPDPASMVEDKVFHEQVKEEIRRCDDRDRTVLTLYYFENLTLAEIGEVLGVSEARVCQIHGKAILRLRSRLRDTDRGRLTARS